MSSLPYHLADRGQSLGMLGHEAVLAGLATGRLSPDTLSWQEGEVGWVALRQRPEFASGVSAVASLAAPPPAMPWEAQITGWSVRPKFTTFGATLKAVLFQPQATFTAAVSSDGLRAPLLWLLWASVVAVLVGFPLWSLLLTLRPVLLGKIGMPETAAPAIFNLTYFFRALLVYPLAAMVGTFVTTFIVHGLLRLFGGGRLGWRRTFRALAYVLGAMCFVLALPVSACAVPVWGFILAILALGFAHQEPAWRGFLAFGLVASVGSCSALIASVWSFARNFTR
jgi:hypothetical protein